MLVRCGARSSCSTSRTSAGKPIPAYDDDMPLITTYRVKAYLTKSGHRLLDQRLEEQRLLYNCADTVSLTDVHPPQAHQLRCTLIASARGLARKACGAEVYHRGIKQRYGVEKSPARKAQGQRNHTGLSLRAYLRLEVHRLRTGISWYEAKTSIIRDALRNYLAHPWYQLPPTA